MTNDDIHEGGCLCGGLRYRAVAGESRTVTHCFCRMCRKATGGTFVTWAEFPAGDFAYTKGEPRIFRSSDLAERGFCGSCGCQMSFQAVGDPAGLADSIWIALGGLDRAGDIAPTHHIFTADKPAWLGLDDDLPGWPSQLPWLRLEDQLPRPTVPQDSRERQPVMAGGGAHQGGCLCGSVRYRGVVDDSRSMGHCHCAMCRKTTGATLVSWIHVPTKDFAFTAGEPRRYRSSHIAERTFCATCGCQFTFRFAGDSAAESESLWITLGSTDRPGDFSPVHQIFTDGRLPWLHLAGDLRPWPGQLPWLRSDDSLSRPKDKGD